MVDEEDASVGVDALLPAVGQRAELVVGSFRLVRVVRHWRQLVGARVDPGGRLVAVVCGRTGGAGCYSGSAYTLSALWQGENEDHSAQGQ